jgi:hydroxymethylpyrimidine pyrophosphatase-like HAD family hydrolase
MLAATHSSEYAIVATDLDGTLLGSDGTLSAFTIETLRRLSAAHIDLVLVTARPFEAARHIAVEVGASTAICLSGSVTYDVQSARVLDAVPLEPAGIQLLRKELGAFCDQLAWGYETVRGRHVEQHWDLSIRGLSPQRLTCILADGPAPRQDVLSLLISCHTHRASCLQPWLVAARERWGAAFSPASGIVEVTARAATKACALARHCMLRNVAPSRVIAFGDSPNDLDMLAWAGLGVAVANADCQVLEAVSITTASNDADGVAHALRDCFAEQLG